MTRFLVCLFLFISLAGCGSGSEKPVLVRLMNDFNNPQFERQPPWTICKAFYRGATFANIERGQTSDAQDAEADLDYVYMVAAWDDTTCAVEHCLPLASKNEEETVAGQERTIVINVPNHQGPCPPQALGIPPMPEELYNKVLELWPEYGFKPYAQRTENPQCQ